MKTRLKNSKFFKYGSNDLKMRYDEHRVVLSLLSFKHPSVLLATWFGCGALFPGPGLWGTIGAVPLALFLLYTLGPVSLVMASLLLFIIGIKVSRDFEAMTHRHDSSIIVIDEVAAVLLALAFAPPTLFGISLTVILFRIFDVSKLWPVSWIDNKVPGAWGVMLDDVFAAFYTILVLGVFYYGGFYGFTYP